MKKITNFIISLLLIFWFSISIVGSVSANNDITKNMWSIDNIANIWVDTIYKYKDNYVYYKKSNDLYKRDLLNPEIEIQLTQWLSLWCVVLWNQYYDNMDWNDFYYCYNNKFYKTNIWDSDLSDTQIIPWSYSETWTIVKIMNWYIYYINWALKKKEIWWIAAPTQTSTCGGYYNYYLWYFDWYFLFREYGAWAQKYTYYKSNGVYPTASWWTCTQITDANTETYWYRAHQFAYKDWYIYKWGSTSYPTTIKNINSDYLSGNWTIISDTIPNNWKYESILQTFDNWYTYWDISNWNIYYKKYTDNSIISNWEAFNWLYLFTDTTYSWNQVTYYYNKMYIYWDYLYFIWKDDFILKKIYIWDDYYNYVKSNTIKWYFNYYWYNSNPANFFVESDWNNEFHSIYNWTNYNLYKNWINTWIILAAWTAYGDVTFYVSWWERSANPYWAQFALDNWYIYYRWTDWNVYKTTIEWWTWTIFINAAQVWTYSIYKVINWKLLLWLGSSSSYVTNWTLKSKELNDNNPSTVLPTVINPTMVPLYLGMGYGKWMIHYVWENDNMYNIKNIYDADNSKCWIIANKACFEIKFWDVILWYLWLTREQRITNYQVINNKLVIKVNSWSSSTILKDELYIMDSITPSIPQLFLSIDKTTMNAMLYNFILTDKNIFFIHKWIDNVFRLYVKELTSTDPYDLWSLIFTGSTNILNNNTNTQFQTWLLSNLKLSQDTRYLIFTDLYKWILYKIDTDAFVKQKITLEWNYIYKLNLEKLITNNNVINNNTSIIWKNVYGSTIWKTNQLLNTEIKSIINNYYLNNKSFNDKYIIVKKNNIFTIIK